MNQLLSVQKLQPVAASNPFGLDLAALPASNRLLAGIRRPDLVAVVGFCAIGLMLTFAAMVRLPEFAAAIAQIGAGS